MTPAEHAQLLRELADTAEAQAAAEQEAERLAYVAATRARQAAAEIEGRKQTGPDLDDLIDHAWRLHKITNCQGERVTYYYNFDRAVRWVLARFGGWATLKPLRYVEAMSTNERPSLWRLMREAGRNASYDKGGWVHDPGITKAAEIRAVADWLVPEEPPLPEGALERIDPYDNPDLYDQVEVGRALARLELRRLLLDEAQRAEAGE